MTAHHEGVLLRGPFTDGTPVLPPGVVDRITATGPLLTWWVPAGLFALTAAVATGALLRGRWRLARALTGLPVALVLLCVGIAAGVNVVAGYVPTLADLGTTIAAWTGKPPGPQLALPAHRHAHPAAPADSRAPAAGNKGAAVAPPAAEQADLPRVSHVSQVLLGDASLAVPPLPVWVYTPPGYDPDDSKRYPVVYLLHGYPGHSDDWFTGGQIQQTMDTLISAHVIGPAIVVAPDLNGGSGLRDTEGLDVVGGPQVQAYVTGTVVQWADRTLMTKSDRAHRFIGGMSSGGYAALNIGLRHVNEFGGIIALEPYGDPGTGVVRSELGGSWAAFRAQSPSSYLPHLRLTRHLVAYVDVPGHGGGIPAARRLATLLRQAGATVTFHIQRTQNHTWTEARLGISYGLATVLGGGTLD